MDIPLAEILLVEDDVEFSSELKGQLKVQGINIEVAKDCSAAEDMISNKHYDIALVDVNLPACRGPRCGYDFVKYVRAAGLNIPVIMLTALGELDDKLEGFNAGADDYITKPFYFQELVARIHAALHRKDTTATGNITIADIVIDARRREVQRAGKLIRLTTREYEILLMLAEANGEPVSKQALLTRVWGTAFSANTNTIEVFMNLLRNKIDKNIEPKLIRTRVGIGYYIGTH